jgi:hypothetical protein
MPATGRPNQGMAQDGGGLDNSLAMVFTCFLELFIKLVVKKGGSRACGKGGEKVSLKVALFNVRNLCY